MPKKIEPKLDRNLLVPFLGETADQIKAIAQLNGMPTTMVVRMVVIRGLEAIKEGKALVLRVPGNDSK
jgi:hypothetical protein